MDQKLVCQLDAGNYFVCAVEADADPLEEGHYLIPAGCVDAPAPTVQEGFRYKWNGSGFDAEKLPEPQPEPPAPDGKDQCAAMAKARLYATDWSQLDDVKSVLKNKVAFDEYRAIVRGLMINPVDNPNFPDEPVAEW